jgi:hypothetical protein
VAGIASVFVFRRAPQILTDAFGNENGQVVHYSRAVAVFRPVEEKNYPAEQDFGDAP